jgi:signal transduction histidine kinase
LLNNAIKFTNEGSITVIVERRRKKEDNSNTNYYEIYISIKDVGTGIHTQIFPEIFTKFVPKPMLIIYNDTHNNIYY